MPPGSVAPNTAADQDPEITEALEAVAAENPIPPEEATQCAELAAEPKASLPNPNRGVVDRHNVPAWARCVSAFFMPLLLPTYAIIVAMWLTPLTLIPEEKRLGATFMVLLLTAIAPMSYQLTVGRKKHLNFQGIILGLSRTGPCIIFIVCQIATAYYLFKVSAPAWLVMFMLAGAATTLVTYIFNFFVNISGHTSAIGYLIALLLYIGRNHYIIGYPEVWIMATVLLAGLVGSARMELKRCTIVPLSLGYLVGFFVTYGVMSLTDSLPFLRLLPTI